MESLEKRSVDQRRLDSCQRAGSPSERPSFETRGVVAKFTLATPAMAALLRMRTLIIAGLLVLGLTPTQNAVAQTYPTAPVKLIVTTGAGGAPDVIARIVAEGLSHRWGQQVFVANHPGAAGSIGMKVAGSAPADGYTLLFALSSSFVALPEIA